MQKLFQVVPIIYFWILMTIVVALIIFLSSIRCETVINDNDLLSGNQVVNPVLEVVNQESLINCDCERTFKKSYPVVWSGKVIATFAGGEDIGIKRYSKEFKYDKFYVDAQGKYNESLGEDVRVYGHLIGITCAHANSVFKECVGEVVADKITSFK